MRSLSMMIAAAAALASCSTSSQQADYDQRGEARLTQALAGKVAGRPVDCLPTYRSGDLVRVDDNTALFRDGPNRVYRNELHGFCNGLGDDSNTLVTTSHSGRLCRGDIARVVDLPSGMTVGSCVIGDFVPYTRAG